MKTRIDNRAEMKNKIQMIDERGTPIFVNCYDNGGKTADRYTVCFTLGYDPETGEDIDYTFQTCGEFWVLAMSENPYNPQGIGLHLSYPWEIDGGGYYDGEYEHLGNKIDFLELPEKCQKLVLSDYKYLWDL